MSDAALQSLTTRLGRLLVVLVILLVATVAVIVQRSESAPPKPQQRAWNPEYAERCNQLRNQRLLSHNERQTLDACMQLGY